MILGSQNIKNSIWNSINTAVYPLLFLAVTPWFLTRLGEHVFGVWMLINTVVLVAVHLGHFGMGQSITMFIAASRGRKSPTRVNGFFTAGLNFTMLVAAGLIALGLLVAIVYPWLADSVLMVNPAYRYDVGVALSLSFILMASRVFEQFFQGFFKGFEAYDTAAQFSSGTRLTALVGQALAVFAEAGLTGVIGITLIVNVSSVLWQYFRCLHLMTEYRWHRGIHRAFINRLSGYGVWAWMQTTLSLLCMQLDRFLVAIFLGTDIVAYYSLASMIANHIHLLMEAPVNWIFPKISRLKSEGRDPLPHFFTVRSFLVASAVIGLYMLYSVREPVFTLWLGADRYPKIIAMIELFLMFELFHMLTISPKFLLTGLGRMKLITGIELFYRVLILLCMVSFFWWDRSTQSLIWAQIAALAIAMPVQAWLVNRECLHRSAYAETVSTMVPVFAIAASLLLGGVLTLPGIALLLVALMALKEAYFSKGQFDVKLLIE